jgi:hypothetical protein
MENLLLMVDAGGDETIVNLSNVKFAHYYATSEPGIQLEFVDGTKLTVLKKPEETQRVWAMLQSRLSKDQQSGPVESVSSGEKLPSAMLKNF